MVCQSFVPIGAVIKSQWWQKYWKNSLALGSAGKRKSLGIFLYPQPFAESRDPLSISTSILRWFKASFWAINLWGRWFLRTAGNSPLIWPILRGREKMECSNWKISIQHHKDSETPKSCQKSKVCFLSWIYIDQIYIFIRFVLKRWNACCVWIFKKSLLHH